MDITHNELLKEVDSTYHYLADIIGPTKFDIQSKFIARVKVLLSEYETLEDLIVA